MSKHLQDCVILFGDSITQNSSNGSLAQRMAEFYVRRLDVLNRGYAGYNSDMGKMVFPEIFALKEEAAGCPVVRLVTIWFGTNDACLSPLDKLCPPSRFRSNLLSFLHNLTSPSSPYSTSQPPQNDCLNIILITPPPIVPTMMSEGDEKGVDGKSRRTLENTRIYREVVLEVGREWEKQREGAGWRLAVVDAWKEIVDVAGGEGKELEPFFEDGVHLSSMGYAPVFEAIKKQIQHPSGALYHRGLDPEDPKDLPFRVPWHREVNMTGLNDENGERGREEMERKFKEGMKLPRCRKSQTTQSM